MLTILATAVAAVYIYYQMRLVMRRWTLALPAHVESSSTSNITLSEWADEKGQDGLYTRRRWMASNGSDEYVNRCEGRTLTRSWSMPEHMSEEELKEWVKSLENEEYASSASAQLSAETGDDSASESAANIKINIQMELGSLLPTSWPPVTPRFPEPSNNVMKSPGLGIPQSVSRDSNCSSPSPPLLELDNAYTPTLASRRPSYSRRIPSSSSISFDVPCTIPGTTCPHRVGGREVADEADAYAIAHGARRPEFRRMRGDSRAALLGRPVDDAALHQCGSSWRREYSHSYGRSRGSSNATLSRSDIDELGRARGDSVSTAGTGYSYGPPTLADLGVVRGEGGYVKMDQPQRGKGESSAAVLGGLIDEGLRTEISRDRNDMESYQREGSTILKGNEGKNQLGDENV